VGCNCQLAYQTGNEDRRDVEPPSHFKIDKLWNLGMTSGRSLRPTPIRSAYWTASRKVPPILHHERQPPAETHLHGKQPYGAPIRCYQ
jgi:hypothetical protein